MEPQPRPEPAAEIVRAVRAKHRGCQVPLPVAVRDRFGELFADYDSGKRGDSATYGMFAEAAALASWLYLSTYIILFGAEANAEIEKHLGRRAVLGEQPQQPLAPT